MRVFSIVFTIIAVALIVFNATKLNLEAPFTGESLIAIITIIAGLCAIMVVQILMISKKIEKKSKAQKDV